MIRIERWIDLLFVTFLVGFVDVVEHLVGFCKHLVVVVVVAGVERDKLLAAWSRQVGSICRLRRSVNVFSWVFRAGGCSRGERW